MATFGFVLIFTSLSSFEHSVLWLLAICSSSSVNCQFIYSAHFFYYFFNVVVSHCDLNLHFPND